MIAILSSTPFDADPAEPASGSEPWLLDSVVSDLDGERALQRLADAERSLSEEILRGFEERRLFVRSRTAVDDLLLEQAEALIDVVPTLAWVVRRCVRSVLILEVDDDAFDQSHSEPALPGAIFVSIPPPNEIGPLRLAEGVVHEAMHLNLGRLEDAVQLTCNGGRLHSPWKEEVRPPSGVLHGLYVFSCLREFFRILTKELPVGATTSAHVARRIDEIDRDMRSIEWHALEGRLTDEGANLVRRLGSLRESEDEKLDSGSSPE